MSKSFEETMKRLEILSAKIRKEETTLEEAIQCYEEGMKCYQQCNEILSQTKQKIELYQK